MKIRFYNPGSRAVRKFSFANPLNDVKEMNCLAYWDMDAPEGGFFEVPNIMELNSNSGKVQVPVRFPDLVQEEYKTYGIIRIDPESRDASEDENTAIDDKSARVKGDRLWREYLETKAREHIFNAEQAGAMGAVPQRARGVYKHALDVLGIADPADKVGTAINKTQDTVEMSEMKKRLAEMEKLLQSMAKGK